ncbi:cation:proton antiporter [Actinospica sp.]|jgi:Kef-type K+ transport system membrane component KefB|uniref:cation:proton antiporter n=1 Tax=Actinospica sp. TaxID=1872142 RepID=UPI002CE874AF|nr:cation:proton antiporter [Actinospica sp.]HWG25250.1 cation:proton antiporter [Actinospica sp.]
MSFGTLAVIVLVGLLGPLLALPPAWRVPVVVGELAAGVLLGPTLAGFLHPGDPTFSFLADIGFALVMFVAGSHVPIRDPRLVQGLRKGAARAIAIGALAVLPAFGLARLFHTGHTAMYAVLIASSSAALVLPMVDSLGLTGPALLELLPQVAIADTLCIVAVPLAVDPAHAGRAALGALAVIGCAGVLFVLLRKIESSGLQHRVHRISEQRKFALELRFSLAALFGLAALAVATHVSIMLAGFSIGLAVAGIGEPRRLTRQLFAVTDGFFSPLFFVWLGAELNLRQLGHRPGFIVLGVLLGLSAAVVHALMWVSGQPISLGVLAASQLGVPVAAATLGTQVHVLQSGEAAALMLGALVTIGAAALVGRTAAHAAEPESSATS